VTGEHTPRPGVTWETRLTSTELVVHDPDDTTAPDLNPPQPPRENRATRRAKQRAARRNR
jgi:hypothetical protein